MVNEMHNDSLQAFHEKLFGNVLSVENVVTKKKSVKVFDEKYYGYFLEKGNSTYFLQDFPEQDKCVLDVLPIVVTKKYETDYNKNVFFFIQGFNSVKIPEIKAIPFKELVDSIANFNHTNPQHWLLYKIISITGWVDRINYRVIAGRGFGKDSVINNMNDLVGSVANIYGATFAKLEYSLKHKLLVFNEMGNLKADDKYNTQQFLLAIGAMFNKYIKKSRATEDTKEEYDISKQSLGILYNPPQYYLERGQEFFDTMFTRAVLSRFIPFYLDGRLNERFDAEFDVNTVVEQNMELYKHIISTLRYYRTTPIVTKFRLPDDINFDDKTRRFERSFLKICDYISEYAETDKDKYYELVYTLYNAYKKYDTVLKDSLSKFNVDG